MKITVHRGGYFDLIDQYGRQVTSFRFSGNQSSLEGMLVSAADHCENGMLEIDLGEER